MSFNGVTNCDCSMCRPARKVSSSPVPVPAKKFSYSAARAAVIDYYTDPKKYTDFNTLEDCGDGKFYVTAKTFDEVSGMRKLGSGMYADVYEMSPTKVLKVIKSQDSGYARFVEVCEQQKGNRYLPVIHYKGVWGGKTVYVLERLEMMKPGLNAYETRREKDHFRRAIEDTHNDNPFMGVKDPELDAIAQILRNSRMTGDLHNGNIMYRGETPVVTDPCC